MRRVSLCQSPFAILYDENFAKVRYFYEFLGASPQTGGVLYRKAVPGGYCYITRSQMIETVARKTGFPESQVETTMDAMFDQIAECLRADEKVTIAGFGRFEMRPRKPKAYTNPKTKVSSRLESTSIPGFKASGRFKQKLEAARAAAAAENKALEETA